MRSGGVTVFVQLLDSKDADVQFYCAAALSNLAVRGEPPLYHCSDLHTALSACLNDFKTLHKVHCHLLSLYSKYTHTHTHGIVVLCTRTHCTSICSSLQCLFHNSPSPTHTHTHRVPQECYNGSGPRQSHTQSSLTHELNH